MLTKHLHLENSYESMGKKRNFAANLYLKLQNMQQTALKNAEKLYKLQESELPADQNPCTTVFELVNELNKCLKK